jgi:hypothetical protein
VRLIDEIETAKDSTGLQGNSLKRPQRVDSRGLAVKSPLHENENYSDPFDDMAVLDNEMRDDDGERTMTFRSVLIGVLTSILGAAIAEVSVPFGTIPNFMASLLIVNHSFPSGLHVQARAHSCGRTVSSGMLVVHVVWISFSTSL